jgi:predicted DNA-binding ribbon-helix-helix protein
VRAVPDSLEHKAMGNVAKRSILLAGHKTSVSLEEPFWSALKEIAREKGMSVSALVLSVDSARQRGNLSSALRTFVLDHYRRRAGEKVQPVIVEAGEEAEFAAARH